MELSSSAKLLELFSLDNLDFGLLDKKRYLVRRYKPYGYVGTRRSVNFNCVNMVNMLKIC